MPDVYKRQGIDCIEHARQVSRDSLDEQPSEPFIEFVDYAAHKRSPPDDQPNRPESRGTRVDVYKRQVLVHAADMEADKQPAVRIQQFGEHTVIHFRCADLQKGHGTEFILSLIHI